MSPDLATPRPWITMTTGSEGCSIVARDVRRPRVARLTSAPLDTCEADAALIVEAVNAYDRLRAALQEIRERIEHTPFGLRPDVRAIVDRALDPAATEPGGGRYSERYILERTGLDAAWAEAETALPEGWNDILLMKTDRHGEPGYAATATGPRDESGAYTVISTTANGRKPDPTPAAALQALASRLRSSAEADQP